MIVTKNFIRQPLVALKTYVSYGSADIVIRALSTKRPLYDANSDIIKSNPYFDKYSDKINTMKQNSPEELENRLLSLFEKKKAQPANSVVNQTKSKSLKDIMQVEVFKGMTANEAKALWENSQHAEHKFAVSLPSEVYRKIEERGKEFSTFLFPLPRVKGFEYIISQFSGNEVHFSPLINYQVFKENAPECLALTHFTDIEGDTNLVLALGEFNKDVLSVSEAVCLYHQLQRYYGEDNPRRLKLIEKFNNAPLDFLHMDLIAELESLK